MLSITWLRKTDGFSNQIVTGGFKILNPTCAMTVVVGIVETRLPRAGPPGPIASSANFTKDQALQAWRGSRAWRSLDKDSSRQGITPRAWQGLQPREGFSSPGQLCLPDRAHMGSAPPAESQTRQSEMTQALSFPCIKQSTKQRQAKEVQDLPLW